MQEGYVDIYGIPTRVMTWGRWIEETPYTSEPEDIILCIPGNPGVTKFYVEFLRKIHEELGYTVWILSHAGHELPPPDSIRTAPPLTDNEKLYGLVGQVNHKIAFIDSYVPQSARIHFIGHSIGAYITLQLLKTSSLREKFLNTHMDTIKNFIRPDALDKIFYMALDEMVLVKERDSVVLFENRDKIRLYYGACDGWVPQKYYRQLKTDIPDIQAELCSHNFEHAFLLRHPEEVGQLVVNWIRK
ncbi:hypothetical protein FQA39_LY03641 [Lamprigera yunnana]|nr:hypothetical protein FQA39_LY03641 [Lamprigera yunnana]